MIDTIRLCLPGHVVTHHGRTPTRAPFSTLVAVPAAPEFEAVDAAVGTLPDDVVLTFDAMLSRRIRLEADDVAIV